MEEGNSTDLTNSKKSNENTKNMPSVNESYGSRVQSRKNFLSKYLGQYALLILSPPLHTVHTSVLMLRMYVSTVCTSDKKYQPCLPL